MDFPTLFVDPVKTTVRHCIAAGDVVAVVGELFAGRQTRCFSDDLITLDDELTAIRVHNHPLSAEQRHGSVGSIFNRNKINEGVRFIRRKRRPAVVIGEFIKTGD